VPHYQPAAPPAPELPAGEAPSSYLFELFKQGLERTSAPTYNALARLGVWPPLRLLPMNDELRLFRVPELGHLRPAWAAFTWTIETLSKAAASAGGRLALAYVPSRMEVSPRTWALTQARYGLDPKVYDRTAVASRVRYIAGRLRVPMLDLTEPLVREDSLLRPTYYQTDSHWNERGQDIAGGAVARFLAEGGLLPGCR
jgi:hypothetical protein